MDCMVDVRGGIISATGFKVVNGKLLKNIRPMYLL